MVFDKECYEINEVAISSLSFIKRAGEPLHGVRDVIEAEDHAKRQKIDT